MASKRNQAKKATKAARDAAFRASHAHQNEAIRSKATGQRPTTNQPSQKNHLPQDSRTPKQLEAPPASAGKASLDADMPKGLIPTTGNATGTIQSPATSMEKMIAAPAALGDSSDAEASAEPPKRSCMRKLLVGTAGVALGVANHVAASAATISAVAAAPPACKTQTSYGMLGGIVSKALDLTVLPVSLVSAIAA